MIDALYEYRAVLGHFFNALAGDDFSEMVYWAKLENSVLRQYEELRSTNKGGRSDEAEKAFREMLDRGNNRENLHKAFEKAIEVCNAKD